MAFRVSNKTRGRAKQQSGGEKSNGYQKMYVHIEQVTVCIDEAMQW